MSREALSPALCASSAGASNAPTRNTHLPSKVPGGGRRRGSTYNRALALGLARARVVPYSTSMWQHDRHDTHMSKAVARCDSPILSTLNREFFALAAHRNPHFLASMLHHAAWIFLIVD